LQILTIPDERLKQVSEPVERFDDELLAFIADLEETRQAGPAAVGIAAPQVGRFQRIVIMDCSQTRKPVPNHGHLILIPIGKATSRAGKAASRYPITPAT